MTSDQETRSGLARAPAGARDAQENKPIALRCEAPPAAAAEGRAAPADHPAEQLARLLYEQRELIADRDRLAAENERLVAERAGLLRERDRLLAELRAHRAAKVPRTSGELRTWRQERGLTQVEAALYLGVGRATVERAEGMPSEAALKPTLRKALVRDAAAVAPRAPEPRQKG
jgi:DNA-binding transcriptional regulator YiaG